MREGDPREQKTNIWMEHGRLHIHDSGDTIRLGMGRLETEDNKHWKILEMKLCKNGIRVG